MPGIVPRWEWRTFGSRFGIAEARFAELTPTGVQESDEVYLVGGAGDNVKIRDDLMDIKVLREVDGDGLERWEPVMKAGFPLSPADVVRTFESLRLDPPDLAREAYTLRQFIDELVVPSGMLRAVEVHKRRVRYVVGGCTSEVSDVVVDGIPSRTIAIESEDAAAVVRAVASVGARRLPEHELRRRPARDPRPPSRAVRRARRRHELDQVPRRRAPARPRLAPDRRSGGDHPARRGPAGGRRDLARGAGPGDRGRGGHGGRGAAERRAAGSSGWPRPACGWPPTPRR